MSNYYAQRNHKFKRRIYYSPSKNDNWQIDLVDLSSKNSGYVLNVIDVFSRKAFSIKLQAKDTDEIKRGLLDAFKFYDGKPAKIQSDREGAIYSNEMKQWFKDQNIELYSVGNAYDGGYSAPIIERFNRSYRGFMMHLKSKKSNQNYNQLSVAASHEFPTVYNNTVHNTTGITPNEAFDGNVKKEEVIKETIKTRMHEAVSKPKAQPKPFIVGDMVYLQKPKKTIENKFEPKFERAQYKIIEVLETEPIKYRLENHTNTYYRKQLRKTLVVKTKYAV